MWITPASLIFTGFQAPQTTKKKFPNYIIGALQRCGESWQYKSIFKGIDNIDLEKELKSYL